jgi:hypothetical protein
MKILTLTQPWATLVVAGAKKIETRSSTDRDVPGQRGRDIFHVCRCGLGAHKVEPVTEEHWVGLLW